MRRTGTAAILIASSLIAWAAPAFAQPPPHAPAHGWRRKHDPNYVGFTGKQWERDFDITSGRCNREEIATVVGAVAGGVIANRIADEHPIAATIVGMIAGAVIGNRIGRELDEADRGCFGHALEIAQPGQRVTWTNDDAEIRYELSPGAASTEHGSGCRRYTLVTVTGRRHKASQTGVACPVSPGVWQIAR